MRLEHYMRERRAQVERALDELLPAITERPERLHKAMRYSVLAPGKRLRPILVLAATEAEGGVPAHAMPTACALECIHAFSLIHDDLPCMDDDDYRRGRPTSHKVFGEALALLAGDALLAFGFELIMHNSTSVGPDRVVAAARRIARASGTWGMVGGQVVDMQSEGVDIDEGTLSYIHAHKTGALLTESVVCGALLAGADSDGLARYERYGRHMGMAFQIADDILDLVGDEAKLGKPVGSDLRQNKATYPKLFGLEESATRAKEEASRAVQALDGLGDQAEPLRALARYVVERDL